MKAIVCAQYGPPMLQFAEVEKPIPKNGEVLVKLYPASINPVDLYCMRGSAVDPLAEHTKTEGPRL